MNYLDFEEPIKELHTQIEKLRESEKKAGVDMTAAIRELEEAAEKKVQEIYGNLDSWQRVQVSRHPDRPYTLQYIEHITGGNWIELHGDRTVKDDKAMVGGFGFIDDMSVMFIGQQKGNTTKPQLRYGQPRGLSQSPAPDEAGGEIQQAYCNVN